MNKIATLLLLVSVCAHAGFSQTSRPKAGPTAVRSAASASTIVAASRTTARGVAISGSLPIRRVILYSNGVAYIERRGFVTGNAEIDLSFKQSQVDDVLKSMVVLDLGEGKIGAVSYNSSAPASARTAEIPFSIDAASRDTDDSPGGLAGVLAQLQGAKVLVTSAKGTSSGSILTVEKRNVSAKPKDDEGGPSAMHTLVISSESGEIISFDLPDIRSVKLLEDGTRRDLTEFANATASTRRRDAKTISISSNGAGQRELVVSYTVAAPIWKTTYRVVLDQAGKPFFQGWAIVDNVSEEDWENVQLSLVSGSPVSFIQNLQKPLYRYRPVIPIPDDLNLDPQVYDAEFGVGYASTSGGGGGGGRGYGSGSGRGTGTGSSDGALRIDGVQNNMVTVQTSISDALINERGGIETAASGSEIGDLFEYKITNPVTVARNRSALIPIVQTKMDGERVSIYNEAARKDRPMGGMMLTNTTPLTFEGGSLTVLDADAYAGEALMERLKPKERRLISFALDLGTRVSTEKDDSTLPVQLIKVVDGVVQAHYFRLESKTYTVVNQTDRPRVVYIEHPIRRGWGLKQDSQKPDIVTDRYYRFRVELAPFATVSVPVVEQQGLMDSYRLSSFTRDQLNLFISQRYIDASTQAKLERIIDLRSQINRLTVLLSGMEKEEERIGEDQSRFRSNIESLAKTPEAKQLIARYIAKANEQETRLEQIETERKATMAEKEKLERELAAEIRSFEIK